MKLTDADLEALLTPCECGHTINDHGELAGCWACADDERDCRVSFEALLTRAVEAIVQGRVNEALDDLDDRCARAVRSLAVVAETSGEERTRHLSGKGEGVELVRDYIRGARIT